MSPGDRDAVPTSSTFSSGDEFDFSPDGNELAYTATPLPTQEEAWKTDHNIVVFNLTSGERKEITTANPAADGFPRYSPDGKYIAYRAQQRAGSEADPWQLMLYERATGRTRSLTEQLDSSVESFVWSGDSRAIYLEAEEKGTKPIWSVSVSDGAVRKVVEGAVNGDLSVSRDGKVLAFARQSLSRPNEVYAGDGEGREMRAISRFATNFKTPTLVIHNELDFRVPINEGLSLFTTLQRKGIPSKFLYFPDEGHWVLKPKNSELWHQSVFAWLAEYLK